MTIVKTPIGQQVMKDRSVALTPKQRSAFILIDGKRTLDQVLAATAPMGVSKDDIDMLFALGLIFDSAPEETASRSAKAEIRAQATQEHKDRTPQERYAEAYPIATRLTAGLGLRGVRLNLAVEAAGTYEELLAVAPRILEAVGAEKYAELEHALNHR